MDLAVILEGTISGDKARLDEAVAFLRHAAEVNLGEFLVGLSNELADVSRPAGTRMAAGLQLKNLLTSKDDQIKLQHQERWAVLTAEIRHHVKTKVLQSLGTESMSPSSAAQCVAYIGCIELPHGEWRDLIPTLLQNVTAPGNTEGLKEASLEAIGYLCEETESSALQDQSNGILTAVVQGMRKEEASMRVRRAATTALLNSLEFTRHNFQVDQERHFIMQVLCENTQCSDARVSTAALQNLGQIVSLYYQYMETYMGSALFAITVQAMQSDDDDIALQGIEFWSTVAEEEIDLAIAAAEAAEIGQVPTITSKHYAKGALQFLVPLLMAILTHQEEDDDDDTWKPNKAASVCLMLLASCCEDDIVNFVLPFVKQNIHNEDWKFREAALMAFSSILEGPLPDTLLPVIVEGIPIFLGRLTDPVPVVKDTLAYCIGRVCELHPAAVIGQNYTNQLLEGILQGIDSEPTIAGNYCLAIASLAETAYDQADQPEDEEPSTYCLSPIFELLVTKLLTVTDRPDANTAHLRSSAYEAVMELVKNSPTDCYPVVQTTMVHIMERVQQLLQLAPSVNSGNLSQFNDIQSLLCAVLQALLRRITKEDAAKSGDRVFAQLISMLQINSSAAVLEDVLMAVGSLIELLGETFLPYVQPFTPFMLTALAARDKHDVCFAAVGLVSDLCRSVGVQAFVMCIQEVMQLLVLALQDANTQKALKPQVLSVMGDVALCLGPHFVPFYQGVLDALQQVASSPVDASDHEYITELREGVLEAYIGVVQSMAQNREVQTPGTVLAESAVILQPHLPTMFTYLEQVASDLYRTDSNIAVACGLIGDLTKCFGAGILPWVDKKVFNSLLQEGRHSKVSKTRALAVWSSKEIRMLKM